MMQVEGEKLWYHEKRSCHNEYTYEIWRPFYAVSKRSPGEKLLQCERYCHNEYTCEVWKPSLLWSKFMSNVKVFERKSKVNQGQWVKNFGMVRKVLS